MSSQNSPLWADVKHELNDDITHSTLTKLLSLKSKQERERKNSANRRRRFGEKEKKFLEEFYLADPFPPRQIREDLASAMETTSRSIQIWFQNRRARDKTPSRTISTVDIPSPPVSPRMSPCPSSPKAILGNRDHSRESPARLSSVFDSDFLPSSPTRSSPAFFYQSNTPLQSQLLQPSVTCPLAFSFHPTSLSLPSMQPMHSMMSYPHGVPTSIFSSSMTLPPVFPRFPVDYQTISSCATPREEPKNIKRKADHFHHRRHVWESETIPESPCVSLSCVSFASPTAKMRLDSILNDQSK